MKTGFQVHKSDWLVIGAFLLIGGLVLLFMIDFFWGFLCLLGAFVCFSQANSRGENGAKPDQSPT